MLRMIGRKEHLSPVDTAWLRMEHPTNLMMITGVFLFDEPVDFDRLRSTLEQGLLRYDRFRQRAVRPALPWAPPYWEYDPDFDLDSHLRRIALPRPGDQRALELLVNDFMSTPLDYSKPLWQFHLVEGYGEGCALLCRLHHCIADGIALVRVLLDLTDDGPDAKGGDGAAGHQRTASTDSVQTGPEKHFSKSRRSRFEAMARQGFDFLSDPTRIKEAAVFGTDGAASLAHLLLLTPDPDTTFKGPLGVRKHCSWTKPIPLAAVKEVGKALGGTVNDVLLSTVAGALGRYLRHQGQAIGGLDFRAVVPVNLRPVDEKPSLGNSFGLVFLSLPVGVDDPVERLEELRRRMDGIKGTSEAVVAFGILNAIGIAAPEIEDIVVEIFGKKATTVMTNVPGPREIRYFAGKPIRGVMFWVPQSGRVGLGVSIISYAGEVLIGINTDAGLTPDPETIVNSIHEEFNVYHALAATLG